jgi:hypothetical protein
MDDLIQMLTVLRMKDVDLSKLSDEELVAKFFETEKQMEKAHAQWNSKQKIKVV